MDDCAAIILAAGASTRLGQPKQLVQLHGESLLRRTVRLACEAACAPVIVVLGRDTEDHSRELARLAALAVINPNWQTGMASSLKHGLRAALNTNPNMQHALLLVCDQPRLDAAHLQKLLLAHNDGSSAITASRYRETLGVPTIFSKKIFPELLALTGDQGARRILQHHADQVTAIDFPGGELDLDTPEDLAKLNL
jgi:molybdenum cofactor cytidylyltransferase